MFEVTDETVPSVLDRFLVSDKVSPPSLEQIEWVEKIIKLPVLAELFVHYSLSFEGELLFSTVPDLGGLGTVHYTYGRNHKHVPYMVRYFVSQGITKASIPILNDRVLHHLGIKRSLYPLYQNKNIELKVKLADVKRDYDVTLGGHVKRMILEEGTSRNSPGLGSDVEFTAVIVSENTRDDEHLSDSAGNKVIKGILGGLDLWEGVEEALFKMKLGEEALVSFPCEYAYQNGKDRLFLHLNLISFTECTPQWEKTVEEKVSFADNRKDSGNKYFYLKLWERALSRYEDALDLINYDASVHIPQSVLDMREVLWNNMASVEMGIKNYGRVIELTNLVLDKNPKNIKALKKRSTARLYSGFPEECIQDVDMALRILKADSSTQTQYFTKLKSLALQKIKKAKSQEKGVFGGIFL